MVKRILLLSGIGLLAIAGGFGIKMYEEGGVPSTVIQKSLTSLLSEPRLRYTGSLSLAQEGASSTEALVIDYSGTQDASSKAVPKMSLSISTKIPDIPELGGLIQAGYLKFDLLAIGDTGFFQLNAVPQSPIDFSPIIGTWIRGEASDVAVATSTERFYEGMAKLKRAAAEAEVLRFTGLLPDAVIGTERVQQYGVVIDKNRFIAFLPVITQHLADMAGAPSSSIQWSKVTEAQQRLATVPAEAFPRGELALYRSSKLPARITMNYRLAPELFELGPTTTALKSISISSITTYSGYGDTFVITVPKETITLKQAIDAVTAATSRPPITLAGPEVESWLTSLSATTRADLAAARELTLRMFGSAKPKTSLEFDTYLGCIGRILQKTTASISVEDLGRLEAKPAAYQLLVPRKPGESQTVAAMRRTLVTTLFSEHLYTEAIDELGFSSVNEVTRLATTKPETTLLASNALACKTLPAPARFK